MVSNFKFCELNFCFNLNRLKSTSNFIRAIVGNVCFFFPWGLILLIFPTIFGWVDDSHSLLLLYWPHTEPSISLKSMKGREVVYFKSCARRLHQLFWVRLYLNSSLRLVPRWPLLSFQNQWSCTYLYRSIFASYSWGGLHLRPLVQLLFGAVVVLFFSRKFGKVNTGIPVHSTEELKGRCLERELNKKGRGRWFTS